MLQWLLVAVAACALVTKAEPKCGGVCNDGVHVCDLQAECNLCIPHPAGQGIAYSCFAGCGRRCTDDKNCGSAGCGSCQEGKCVVPTPRPPTTPAPPLPAAPCIRFGHTMPFPHAVDVTVVQTTPANNRSYIWTNHKYGQFSDWVGGVFEVGSGKAVISSGGKQLLEVHNIPLTPGPLVIVLKCFVGGSQGCTWPPVSSQPGGNVQTIAASFPPLAQGSSGRLFNLVPDTTVAGLLVGADKSPVVDGVQFQTGSEWVRVPPGPNVYTATANGAPIATVSYTPDAAPAGVGVFTQWLIGERSQNGTFAPKLLPLADAPETGRCMPMR